MERYDYLIVGAGLFGLVFAYKAKEHGKKCLIIDRRDHIGGNTYVENREGINVHRYGPHIFHTNSKKIWDFVNKFTSFNNYINSPIAVYRDKIYNLPFNMNTFYQLWGITSPHQAEKKIEEQSKEVKAPRNLEETAVSLVGRDIYETLIKGYTTKQWGRPPRELPSFIIKRLPLRFTFDNNYYSHRYQGIPIGGYNVISKKLVHGIELKLSTDFFAHRSELEKMAKKIVFTGKIDEFYDYCFGKLEYRSLRFHHKHLNVENFQGNAVVNYTDLRPEYTRIIEHKHFEFGTQKNTIVTEEYPEQYKDGKEPYYPLCDRLNENLYKKYKALSQEDNVIFGGRLAEYRYYDMDQVIASGLSAFKNDYSKN